MTPEQWEKVSEIFHEASDLEGDERGRYLDAHCDGDEILRCEVESLLAANKDAGSFISEPVAGAFATRLLKGATFATGEMLGHYRIISKIASGGMGEVFLAADTKLGRNVALKTLSPVFEGDEEFLSRFRNEARAAAALNHPHVATVYSVEDIRGHTFIAMEYIEGKTLQDLIPDGGVDVETFVAWFVPVARALEHAHSRGVIHRDIKPGNIMMTNDGIIKILDFGLAYFGRPVDHVGDSLVTDLTQPGQILGTPAYMSPEQAEGKDVDHRSDIFSLGVVMYEAITGEKPFRGETNADVVSNLLKSDAPPVTASRPDAPAEISKVVTRCLKKRRRDRPRSMTDIRDALGGVSSTASGSFSQRFYRQVRAGRIWPNFVGAAIVLAIAAVGWFYFSRSQSNLPASLANMTLRRLSQSNNVVFASISPDARSIAYVTIEENGNRGLWLRRVDDRNALELIPSQPVQYWGGLTMNNDLSQVYFITANRAGTESTMYRISSMGGQPRRITDGVNDLGSLSADGRRVLFVRYKDQLRILSANADDGSDERVIREEETPNSVFRDPQYSFDERHIYYSRMDRIDGVEWWALVQLPANGGDETVIIPRRKERISEVAVLSDGKGLVINGADPASGLSQLFHVSLPDGELTRLTNDLNSYFGVSIDRSNRSIVAAQRYDERSVWVGDVGALADSRPITPEPNVNRFANWTPDGRIVYDALDNSTPHIWIVDSDGKNAQQLTPNDSSDQHPSVSADGRFIVFTSNRNGIDQIWRMNIDGSNQVLLANVDGVTTGARFAPDGQTVYFYWTRGTETVLGRMPVTGGNVMESPRYSDGEWAMSPDGSRVAYVVRDQGSGRNNLAVLRLDSPTPEMILDSAPIYLLKWRPDSQAVLTRERDQGENPYGTIMEYELAARRGREYLSTAPEYVVDLSFSRDGKRAALVRGTLSTDAVMLSSAPLK
ncbi:MAG TPA: protein kinase [Pyrinomonadaceae bacterium]|nr:protein kinase [Pyrinomonadaceae bacterium]